MVVQKKGENREKFRILVRKTEKCSLRKMQRYSVPLIRWGMELKLLLPSKFSDALPVPLDTPVHAGGCSSYCTAVVPEGYI